MYKVFVNDKPLFLTNEISKETNFQLFLLESVDIVQLIVKIFQNKIQKAYLYYPDEKEILKTLTLLICTSKKQSRYLQYKNYKGMKTKEILMECTLKYSQGKGLERFSNGELKQTTNGVKYILICG